MNLAHSLPSAFEARGLVVTVHTGAAAWMWAAGRLDTLDNVEGMALLERFVEKIERAGQEIHLEALAPDEARRVFERLLWFMGGGIEHSGGQGEEKRKERLIDYEKDLDAIYAAFLQSYGLDLYTAQGNGKPLVETMHWWRFLALVSNLPPGSLLVDYYMHYRGLEIAHLPRKTEADRQHMRQIIEIKRRVALGQAAKKPAGEKSYAIRARLLKERGNG